MKDLVELRCPSGVPCRQRGNCMDLGSCLEMTSGFIEAAKIANREQYRHPVPPLGARFRGHDRKTIIVVGLDGYEVDDA